MTPSFPRRRSLRWGTIGDDLLLERRERLSSARSLTTLSAQGETFDPNMTTRPALSQSVSMILEAAHASLHPTMEIPAHVRAGFNFPYAGENAAFLARLAEVRERG